MIIPNKTIRDLHTTVEIAHNTAYSVFLEHYQGFGIIYNDKTRSLFKINFSELSKFRYQVEDETLLKHLGIYLEVMEDMVQQNERIIEFWADLMGIILDTGGRKKLDKLLYDRYYLSENYKELWKLEKFKEGNREIKEKAQNNGEN